MSQISREYNISKSTISAIKNKRLWAHLTKNVQFDTDYKRISRSQLTPQQVDGIIKLLLQGLTYQEISNIFNCPKTVIQDIKLKRTWKQKTQNINFN
jgi:DNA-binding NarL/FixJ family response regulator